jgi:hypothetical protein
MTTFLRILAAFLALASAGCVETRFESPIGDNIETCDARWKGLWVDVDLDRRVDRAPEANFYVDEECQFMVLVQPEKNGALKQIHVPVNYVHADRKDYIVVADTAIRGLVDLKPPHGVTPVPDKSFFYARYRLRGDRIELYPVDSARVAKLVLDGRLEGTVDKVGTELHVYVGGSRAQMLEAVRTLAIFDEKNGIVLVRSRQTLEQYEKSMLPAGAGAAR